jgi:hypothetical protein
VRALLHCCRHHLAAILGKRPRSSNNNISVCCQPGKAGLVISVSNHKWHILQAANGKVQL